MVFDYCEYDLTGLMETVKYKFTESQVRQCRGCSVCMQRVRNHATRARAPSPPRCLHLSARIRSSASRSCVIKVPIPNKLPMPRPLPASLFFSLCAGQVHHEAAAQGPRVRARKRSAAPRPEGENRPRSSFSRSHPPKPIVFAPFGRPAHRNPIGWYTPGACVRAQGLLGPQAVGPGGMAWPGRAGGRQQ
jgi:hypothetical protein